MKNIYLKAVAVIFSAALVFTSCTKLNGHEWVDLGLSVRWATCNVGASVPLEYGDYYAWGEIETKMEYTEENSVTSGVELDDISGNPQYDVATANWGEGWRMPTEQELDELTDKCRLGDWRLLEFYALREWRTECLSPWLLWRWLRRGLGRPLLRAYCPACYRQIAQVCRIYLNLIYSAGMLQCSIVLV